MSSKNFGGNMPSITQCAKGSRKIGAAAMLARTCRSTSKDMFCNTGEGARGSRRGCSLSRVPGKSQRLEKLAGLAVLGESRIELHDQGTHGTVAQGALHAADHAVLESIHVDFDVVGDGDLAVGHEGIEREGDATLGEGGAPGLQIEPD